MGKKAIGVGLKGSYRVRALRAALAEARRLLPRTSDRMELRKQVLKLRYWPEKKPVGESGVLLELDWSWIRALQGLNVGELRIGEVIGGCNNLRAFFYVGGKRQSEPMPTIWILHVMQKKRDEFTVTDLSRLRMRRSRVPSQ